MNNENYSNHLDTMEELVRYLTHITQNGLPWRIVYVKERPLQPSFATEAPSRLLEHFEGGGTLVLENRSTNTRINLALYIVQDESKVLLLHHMTPRNSDYVNDLLDLYIAVSESVARVLEVLTRSEILPQGSDLIQPHTPFILKNTQSRVNKPPDAAQHSLDFAALGFANVRKRLL